MSHTARSGEAGRQEKDTALEVAIRSLDMHLMATCMSTSNVVSGVTYDSVPTQPGTSDHYRAKLKILVAISSAYKHIVISTSRCAEQVARLLLILITIPVLH